MIGSSIIGYTLPPGLRTVTVASPTRGKRMLTLPVMAHVSPKNNAEGDMRELQAAFGSAAVKANNSVHEWSGVRP